MYDTDKPDELKARISELEKQIAGYEKQESTFQAYKIEALETLAGGIAHDFNNILGVIMANTELAMDDTPENISSYDNLREIFSACLRAKDIVKQILPFSYQNRGRLHPLEIAEAVRDAINLLRPSVPDGVEIRENIINSNCMVMADQTQVCRLLNNLFINAAHSMQQNGFIDVGLSRVFLDPLSAGQFGRISCGHYVKLCVRDTGCGISPDIVKKIFDPYFTTKPVGEGTGMGLAVVHGIVRNLGGEIAVFSKLYEGTLFEIYFPVVAFEPSGQETMPSPVVVAVCNILQLLFI